MPVEEPKDEALNSVPNCGICEQPMVRLSKTTKKKFDAVWVCAEGKLNSRMPCDGHVFEIALKNG